MASLSDKIMEYAETFPEGMVFGPKSFLHLGNRAAIDQALGGLVRRGGMIRIFQGRYVRTINTRSGKRSPDLQKVLDSLQKLLGGPIVPSGAFAAKSLGLTDQVPPRETYLVPGPDRRLSLGKLEVDLCHAPRWQLVAPGRLAGTIIRALAFLGPRKTEDVLNSIVPSLSETDFAQLISLRSRMPLWIAEPLSAFIRRPEHTAEVLFYWAFNRESEVP